MIAWLFFLITGGEDIYDYALNKREQTEEPGTEALLLAIPIILIAVAIVFLR